MPALKVALHKEAIAEARAAREWYEIRNVAAAEAFMEELDRIVARIGEYPEGGALYLEAEISHAAFSILRGYRQKRRTYQVVAIAHSKRKPG